jgi:RimJ/RimL family protein N-acetyltransferase
VIPSSFLPIATERLVLRRFTPADAAGLAAYRSEPAVARYQSWATPYSVSAAQRLIGQPEGRRVAADRDHPRRRPDR